MDEKLFILTEKQLAEALRIAAMGGAGLLSQEDFDNYSEILSEEIKKKALIAAVVANCIRTEGPLGAISKFCEVIKKNSEK